MDLPAEDIQYEGFPVISFRDARLVGRNLMKGGYIPGMGPNLLEFRADLRPRSLDQWYPIEACLVEDGLYAAP